CVGCSIVVCIFFFSSRRRHTRCYRDWSSDVCSSDLDVDHPRGEALVDDLPEQVEVQERLGEVSAQRLFGLLLENEQVARLQKQEIGRASCRERVEIWEGAGETNEKEIGTSGNEGQTR